MAVTAAWYGKAALHLAAGDIDYDANTIKVALLTSAYTFNQDTHETYADIVGNEVAAGNGYTARGAALASKSITYDAATNRARLFAANTAWTPGAGQTLTAAKAVIYKDTGTNTTSYLLGYVDFGATISAIGAPFTISWDTTDGLLYLNVATIA